MMDSYMKVYEDLTTAAHRAYHRGIQTGSGGNISARIPGREAMVVKNSGGSFIDCAADGTGWLAVGFDGTALPGQGAGAPTREWKLHAALLRALPDIGGVVHTHSPWAVAWAERNTQIPMTTWHSRLKFGCAIPVLDIPAAVVPDEDLGKVVGLFLQTPGLPAMLLRGHGIVAVGKTATDAEHVAEMVEETAQITALQALLDK